MREFEKGYKLPFTTDGIMYIFDADGVMALQTIKSLDTENMNKLCDQLNGKINGTYENDWEYCYIAQSVLQNGREMFSIRGWGHLTGTGGLNLPDDEAQLIQDDLGEYVAEMMRKV